MPKAPDIKKSAIVVAAGSSSRMGGKVRKPYLKLRGKPILAWTLSALGKIKGLRQIVLVTRPDDRKRAQQVVKLARLAKSIQITFADGGPRRQDSVLNGLKASSPDSALLLIHDAARPFPRQDAIAQACDAALQIGASILATRVKDTVKKGIDSKQPETSEDHRPDTQFSQIENTIPRAGLWLAQTPQIFRRSLILNLFERMNKEAADREFTDDASICEFFQQPVALIESSDTNFKVTRPEDLKIADAYLKLGLVK